MRSARPGQARCTKLALALPLDTFTFAERRDIFVVSLLRNPCQDPQLRNPNKPGGVE